MSEFTAHTWKEIRNMWSGPVKMCFQTDINAFDSHTKQTHALDWKETQINPTIKNNASAALRSGMDKNSTLK